MDSTQNVRLTVTAETTELIDLRQQLNSVKEDMDALTSTNEYLTSGYQKMKKAVEESAKSQEAAAKHLNEIEEDRLEAIGKLEDHYKDLTKTIEKSGKSQIEITKDISILEIERKDAIEQINAEINKRARLIEKASSSEKGAIEALIELESEYYSDIKDTEKQIESSKKSIEQFSAKINKLEMPQKIRTELMNIRNEMERLDRSTVEGQQRFNKLSEEAEILQKKIAETSRAIQGMAANSQFLTAAMGVGQGVTGAFTLATSAMAVFGGEAEELQKAFFKVQAALQILNGAQMLNNTLMKTSTTNAILRNTISKLFTKSATQEAGAITAGTTATVANAAATKTANTATKIWNATLLANPLMWVVAGVMAAIYAINKLAYAMDFQGKKTMDLMELERKRFEQQRERDERAKEYSDNRLRDIDREIDVMRALGMSYEAITEKQRERIAVMQEYSDQQFEAHKKEIDSIEDNKKALEKYTESVNKLGEATLSDRLITMQYGIEIDGIKFRTISAANKYLKEKVEGIEANIKVGVDTEALVKDTEKAVIEQAENERREILKNAAILAQIRVNEAKKGSNEELNARIDAINEERKVALAAANQSAEEIKKINSDADLKIRDTKIEHNKTVLSNEKTGIEARATMAKKGSLEEFDYRMKLIEQERKIALASLFVTANERLKIEADAEKKRAEFREQYRVAELQDVKSGLEAQLALTIDGTTEEFEIRKKLLFQQHQIEIQTAHLTANQREKIENEYLKNLKKINDDFNKKASEDAINIQIATINMQLHEAEKGTKVEYELRKQLVEKQAALERASIETSTMNEELKAAKILEINAKLQSDLTDLHKEWDAIRIENSLKNLQIELEAERLKIEKTAITGNFIQRMKARTELRDFELKMIQSEEDALTEKYKKGIINTEEYNQRMAELANERTQQELNAIAEAEDGIKQIKEKSFELFKDIVSMQYDQQKEMLQRQLDDLKQFYTTDAEAAAENADLKLITAEELKRRELKIKQEIAKADKEKALFQATIDGIAGVVKALGSAVPPYNLILAAITAAATAVQIAQISSQPIPRFAKGKKGKQEKGGQFSWVGEHGPEIMFVPDHASIIPAHKSKSVTPEVMKEYNIRIPQFERDFMPVPRFDIPDEYRYNRRETVNVDYGKGFDYNKLGRAVAENLPEMNNVSIEMNEKGFEKYISQGNNRLKILNSTFNFN